MIDPLWLTLCSYFANALAFDTLLMSLQTSNTTKTRTVNCRKPPIYFTSFTTWQQPRGRYKTAYHVTIDRHTMRTKNNENMKCQCSVATFSRQCSANLLGRTLFQQRQLRDWFLIHSSFRLHFTNADSVVFSRKDLHDTSKGPVSPLGLLVDNQN